MNNCVNEEKRGMSLLGELFCTFIQITSVTFS